MNNFPIQSPTDLFATGLLGSSGGLFDSQLTYVSDLSLIHDSQSHTLYYPADIRDEFNSFATTVYDSAPAVGYGSTAMVAIDAQIDVYNSGTSLVTEEGATNALFNTVTDVSSEPQTVGKSEDLVSSVVSEEDVTDSAVASIVNCSSAGVPSDQSGSSEVVMECATENSEASEDPIIDISISNVVCAFSTKCYLSLKRIATKGMNVEYKRATGNILMKLRKPLVTASIWASGKVTCTGSRSEEEAHIAARRVARCLQKICGTVKFAEFRIVNVLGTCSLPFGIRINEFSRRYPKEASYEPEIHPGVTYRILSPKATLKIFSTGSITVTGPRISNIQRAIEHIYPCVVEFRIDKSKAESVDPLSSSLALQPNLQFMKPLNRTSHSNCNQKQKQASWDNEDSDGSVWSATDEESDASEWTLK